MRALVDLGVVVREIFRSWLQLVTQVVYCMAIHFYVRFILFSEVL